MMGALAPDAAADGTVYSYPMHPEVRQGPSRQLPQMRRDAGAQRQFADLGRRPALAGVGPKTARHIRDAGAEEGTPWAKADVRDRLRIRLAEKVPVDGTGIAGGSAVGHRREA